MQKALLTWYDRAQRDLPWRRTCDPYAIWVSEIMLQQTRAETVTDYWTRFLSRFPTVFSLAEAAEQDVLKAWEGLGYYSRARNLLACALMIRDEYDGKFPTTAKGLRALPGVGEYTAGAVASIAFAEPVAAVDGNVERVAARLLGIREDVGIPTIKRQLRMQVQALVPTHRPGDFNQAMMELGARVCKPTPNCMDCPIQPFCDAFAAGDADMLPMKQKKAPQKAQLRGVALVFHQGRVLLMQRDERLLRGMWCFPSFEGAETADQVEHALHQLGIQAQFVEYSGNARHMFTHLIWDMHLLHFNAFTPTCPAGFRWVDMRELDALPLPTAMKAAKAVAKRVMEDGEETR